MNVGGDETSLVLVKQSCICNNSYVLHNVSCLSKKEGNMYCPSCGKEIADEAVVCISCGRPVTPLKQAAIPVQDATLAGAKAVHDTARAFLVCGILNILAGILSVAVGWVFGIFAVIVGIIELVNANKYWPIPPKSTSNPTFLPTLEMLAAFCGSLWSLIIGFGNRQRLNSPEVKNYFLALQSGQPVMAMSSSNIASAVASGTPIFANHKKCPSCGNSIPIEAKICQYCRQNFSDEEIETAKKQVETEFAQKRAEAAEASRLKRAKTLRVVGGILAVIGLLILLLFVAVMFAPTTSADSTQGFIMAVLCFPTPLILVGGGLFAWGTYSLRKIKEEKDKPKPVQTIGI
jgi:hypothetical protein